jgi:hypothetical protein
MPYPPIMQNDYGILYCKDIAGYLKRCLPLHEVRRWLELVTKDVEYGAHCTVKPDGRLCFEPEFVGDPTSVAISPLPISSLHSHPCKHNGVDLIVCPSRADICISHKKGTCWQLIATRAGILAHRFAITFPEELFASTYGRQCPIWYADLQNAFDALDVLGADEQKRALRRLKCLVRKQYPGLLVDFVPWRDLVKHCRS